MLIRTTATTARVLFFALRGSEYADNDSTSDWFELIGGSKIHSKSGRSSWVDTVSGLTLISLSCAVPSGDESVDWGRNKNNIVSNGIFKIMASQDNFDDWKALIFTFNSNLFGLDLVSRNRILNSLKSIYCNVIDFHCDFCFYVHSLVQKSKLKINF